MAIQIQTIGDITKFMAARSSISKKMEFELSNDETFYNSKLYYDFYDKDTNTTREGYVSCKSKPTFVDDCLIVPDSDEAKTIFTLTIPCEGELK